MNQMNSYDDIKKLYDFLANDEFAKAKEIVRHLIKNHQLSKKYITSVMRTIALEKMLAEIYDQVKSEE